MKNQNNFCLCVETQPPSKVQIENLNIIFDDVHQEIIRMYLEHANNRSERVDDACIDLTQIQTVYSTETPFLPNSLYLLSNGSWLESSGSNIRKYSLYVY